MSLPYDLSEDTGHLTDCASIVQLEGRRGKQAESNALVSPVMPGGKDMNPPPSTASGLLELPGGQMPPVFRLTVGFMVLVILSFVSVEGWRAWRDYERAYGLAHDSVINLARATAQHAEDAIRQVDVLSGALADRVEGDGLGKIDIARLHTLMIQQAKIMPQLHGLFIYGADGRWIVTSSEIAPEGANNADRDYFIYHRSHTDRNVRIGEVVQSRSTHDLIMPISRRLNNPDGSFAGVLLGTIKMSYFLDYYGDFKIDDGGAMVLAMRDGKILMRRPFLASVIGKSLADSEIFKRYLRYSKEGVAEVDAVVDGTPRIYGYRALDTYPLVVATGLPKQSFIRPWRQDLFKTGIALLALIIGLASFGAIVLGQLRQRIRLESELRVAHQTVQNMALTDSLTGLANRRHLDTALEQEVGRAKRQGYPLSLIMLDVDHFKRFNDRYGHLAGDECLQEVAGVIKRALKRPADTAARYGGEEFTVLLPDTDMPGAIQVAQEILQAIVGLGIAHSDNPCAVVTASAGVSTAFATSREMTPAGMIKAADACLYYAKHSGRNRIHAISADPLLPLPM